MDPTETWALVKEIVFDLKNHLDSSSSGRLATVFDYLEELIQDMDGWFREGGFAPYNQG